MRGLEDIDRARSRREDPVSGRRLAPLARLARLDTLLAAFQAEVLAPFDLQPSDYDVLTALRRADPQVGLRPSQLYGSLGLSSGGMTKILGRLDRTGLVERTRHPEDGRGRSVRLTERGRSLQERTERAFATATEALLSPFDAQQVAETTRHVEHLIEAFEGILARRGSAPD